ncbi:MAG: peptidylprolyl isomerase [Deltaproteobacteria bacterium]|jgi:peptidylprolyl isomerase|nr:peptidylprolyl isomerase [Deltaproteobacteria bacterium]MBT4639183.1 peptidylprolyl isomerase [Deltaproteobacteria bacterium]MBT6501502.1 peptidylprolyl isomerase [Deltaproteobacteria bacterium]MBT6610728.1 peptidylprolyl isomerase [Deltaproteobacteria bacterium]MBT7713248.1 peptidylprolyl isomerase [Deltaproteobacteria bacterium]
MTQVNKGDKIKVHYTGKLEDGTQFDSSVGSDPLEFTIGAGQLIPGFDNGVVGMVIGDKRIVTIPAAEAYGERNEELVLDVEKSQLPPDIEPQIGQMLQSQQPDGNLINMVITNVNETSVTVDANPPLAGKTLIFEIELVEVA